MAIPPESFPIPRKIAKKIAEALEGGDLGAASTKLFNKLGFDTPKQKLEKKKKDKPMKVETINVKKGGQIKCGVQTKGTSPILRKGK